MTIAIVGLGYVDLPLVCLLSKGNAVTTIDINLSKANHMGRSHISQRVRVTNSC